MKALSIVSSDEYLVAGNELVRLREMRKRAQERVDRLRKPAYDAYQATLELQRRELESRFGVIRPQLQCAVEVDGRFEEAEAEAKRKAKELAEADAKVAEAQGQPEVAAQIRQQPLPLTPVRVQNVVLPKDVPKVKGIIERAPVWKWRVRPGEDHLVPREYLTLNEKAINAAVTNQKSLTNIAGIEVWDEEARVGVKAAK